MFGGFQADAFQHNYQISLVQTFLVSVRALFKAGRDQVKFVLGRESVRFRSPR